MELPESLFNFAESIGSIKCRGWSRHNRSILSDEYKMIKDGEYDGNKVSSRLELLIEKTVELDEVAYKAEISAAVVYEKIFNGKLPKSLSELDKDIWFLEIVRSRKAQWKALDRLFLDLKRSNQFSSTHMDAKRNIISILSKEELYLRGIVIRQLDVTKKAVVLQRIDCARSLYPLAFRTVNVATVGVAIGLGVESTYKSRVIRAVDVTFDENTKPIKDRDQHVLYIPGWSINGAFSDSD